MAVNKRHKKAYPYIAISGHAGRPTPKNVNFPYTLKVNCGIVLVNELKSGFSAV